MKYQDLRDNRGGWQTLLPGPSPSPTSSTNDVESGLPNTVEMERKCSGESLRQIPMIRHVPFSGLSLSSAAPSNEPSPSKEYSPLPESIGTPILRCRNNRSSTRKMRKRVVFKNGDCNVVHTNVSKRKRRYLADIVTTLVDIQWRWTLLVFTLSFLLSWLAFAVIWWLIAFTHGDLEESHLPGGADAGNWIPCVAKIKDFTSCFLFSVETQHTIGYGSRYTTEECPEAIFVMCTQSIMGVMIQALMVGIAFAKLSRPKKRAQTLMFSRNAVICQRDSQLCFLFRIGNMRTSHIVESHVRALLVHKQVTKEGELIPYALHEMKVGYMEGDDRVFFIWPLTIVHVIDADSPLYNLSANDLLKERFEIVIILEGVIESTGMTTQARSSYLPAEILWGHRFDTLITFKKDSGQYSVDYSKFNTTYEVDTPLCSGRELDEFRRMHGESLNVTRLTTPIPDGSQLTFNNNFDLMRHQLAHQQIALQSPSVTSSQEQEEGGSHKSLDGKL